MAQRLGFSDLKEGELKRLYVSWFFSIGIMADQRRIIPVFMWLGSPPFYNNFKPFGRSPTTLLRGLINHDYDIVIPLFKQLANWIMCKANDPIDIPVPWVIWTTFHDPSDYGWSTYPTPRNTGLIAGLFKGSQWLSQALNKFAVRRPAISGGCMLGGGGLTGHNGIEGPTFFGVDDEC